MIFDFLGDHSSCTSRRCEVCPARDNSENPSRNSDPVAENFSFEHENRKLTNQEVKKEPSEETSRKVHSEQDYNDSDIDDNDDKLEPGKVSSDDSHDESDCDGFDDSEYDSNDDEDDEYSDSEAKADLIRVIKIRIGASETPEHDVYAALDPQNREKYEKYRLQPIILEQMDLIQLRELVQEVTTKHHLQTVEHHERLLELENKRELQAEVEKVRSRFDKLTPEEKKEFHDHIQNNIKEIEMPLENLDKCALKVIDFKLEEFLQKRKEREENEKRICKLKTQVDKLSDDSKSIILYHIKLDSLEKLPHDHLKHLEDEVQRDLSKRNRGFVLTIEHLRNKLINRDRNVHNEFMGYAQSIVTEASGQSGLDNDTNDKVPFRLNLNQLDTRTLEILVSKAQSLLTILDSRQRKSSHEEESRPKKKSRNEL